MPDLLSDALPPVSESRHVCPRCRISFRVLTLPPLRDASICPEQGCHRKFWHGNTHEGDIVRCYIVEGPER